MPAVRLLLTRLLISYLRITTALLRRAGILEHVPGEAPETFLTLSDIGLKPSDVVKASNFVLMLMLCLIIPLSAALFPIRDLPIVLAVLITATVVLHRGPFILLSVGVERFSAGVRESITANLGAIISALEEGDEVRLVEVLRASSPEVRRIVAEAQLSSGGGTIGSIAKEALSYPDVDVKLLTRLASALRDKSARASLTRALGRASLSQVEEDLKVPMRKAFGSVESASSWLTKLSFLIFMLIPLLSLLPIYLPLEVRVLGVDAYTFLLSSICLLLSAVVLRKLSKVDMDPWTLEHPKDVLKLTVLVSVLSLPAVVLSPLFLAVVPLASFTYWYAGVKPFTSTALEELILSLRAYSTARKEGLNRIRAMEEASTSISHPETRKWIRGALSAWYLQSSDLLWGAVASNIHSYPGLYALLKSLDDADRSEEGGVVDEIIELLELSILNYGRTFSDLADKIADTMFDTAFVASLFPLMGVLMSKFMLSFLGSGPDPSVLLAIGAIPLSVVLGFYRASKRCGIVKLIEGVWILILMLGLSYSAFSLILLR